MLIAALALPVFAIGVSGCRQQEPPSKTAAPKAMYHCPMHPDYTSDKPGDCPICGMRLVLMKQTPPEEKAAETNKALIPGQAVVDVDPRQAQLIGLTTAQVEVRDLYQSIRASARIAYDPGLYTAILEHREAAAALRKSRAAGNEDFAREAESTVRASKLRLRQLGLSDGQIAQAEEPGFDPSNLLVGQAGGSVWAYIDLYDYEARLIKPGSRATFTTSAIPGKTFEGRVRSVDQVVNAETRTLRARALVPNPNNELKPEMYLNANLYVPLGKRLSVPDTAILDTGTRRLAFVVTAPGRYEPREVSIGREASGYFEVLSGLKEGDVVVNSANFLIDSESKIRGAVR
jgi:Cu(I)/Ag(I) efflux system membrane fusion protein